MAKKRDVPYIWVTWLPSIMLGSASCCWGPWFKANYTGFAKQPSGPAPAIRTIEHAQRLDKMYDAYLAAGSRVTREDQNLFQVRRSSGLTVGGKPDLIVCRKEQPYWVFDIKTGARRDSHVIQVMLYMALLPFSKRFGGKTFSGSVCYDDYHDSRGEVRIPETAIDDSFKNRLARCLDILGSAAPPPKCPSEAECRFCDISGSECPERASKAPLDESPGDLPF